MTDALAIVSSGLTSKGTARQTEVDPAPALSGTASLTRRLVAGEEKAFLDFHDHYAGRLYRLILVLTRGEETAAQDALQETFCRVARYIRRFEEEETFWCWLAALARSAVRDAGRKRQRYRNLLRNYARRWLPVLTKSELEEENRLQDLLDNCLVELSPEDRVLIEAKYVSKCSLRELARQTGLTERAVESRLLRLRQQLRQQIIRKLRKSPE